MTSSTPRDPSLLRHEGSHFNDLARDRDRQTDTIEVVEETARIGIQRRETGGVRVRLMTEAVEEILQAQLGSQRVEVSRHPVEREVDAIPAPREEGDLLIIPVVEERAVVRTVLVLTEEIHVRRVHATETVDVPVSLRRQRAVVEPLEPGPADPGDPDPGQPPSGYDGRDG